jgi:hypothetical protein
LRVVVLKTMALWEEQKHRRATTRTGIPFVLQLEVPPQQRHESSLYPPHY